MGSHDRVKQSTSYRKKRKWFVKKKEESLVVEEDVNNVNNTVDMNVNMELNDTNIPDVNIEKPNIQNGEPSSVSSRKVQEIPSLTKENISGYRIIDMELLSNVFEELCCPKCSQPNLLFSENNCKKKGSSSMLTLNCSCGYLREFHTSRTCGKGYDINRRISYSMRAMGQGYMGIEKFTALMNIPKPFTVNVYNKIVDQIATATEEVAQETIEEAVESIREMKGSTNDEEIIDIGVSLDGTWQRRGFSSNNGVVAALSIDTGKVVDIEVMSKVCKACTLKDNLKKNKKPKRLENSQLLRKT